MNMEEHLTLTVSELNSAVKSILESDLRFLNLCVLGELSNYKIYPSGHHYFTLKDQESSLRCVMFRSNAIRLRFRPENGMKVSAAGSLKVYPRDGIYQLYCSNIVPEGIGDLQIAFEQLKQRLGAEGLFDEEHKKSLPQFPKTIALITSSAGAAVHDMIRIIRQRWPMTKLALLPVRVQGSEAPLEISSAIRYANAYQVADLIITGRGGGSLEDLWAFNDERVARAIYDSQIPVISAVGHEPDVSISDYVADKRASTPSNAAEIAVPDRHEMEDVLNGLRVRLDQVMLRKIQKNRQTLNELLGKKVLSDASSFVDIRRLELDRISDRLSAEYRQILHRKKNSFVKQAAALDAMNPLKVMMRGYLLAADQNNKPVQSVRQLSVGDRLKIRLYDGSAECLIEQLEETANAPQKQLI